MSQTRGLEFGAVSCQGLRLDAIMEVAAKLANEGPSGGQLRAESHETKLTCSLQRR
jgi:hypothetical protein